MRGVFWVFFRTPIGIIVPTCWWKTPLITATLRHEKGQTYFCDVCTSSIWLLAVLWMDLHVKMLLMRACSCWQSNKHGNFLKYPGNESAVHDPCRRIRKCRLTLCTRMFRVKECLRSGKSICKNNSPWPKYAKSERQAVVAVSVTIGEDGEMVAKLPRIRLVWLSTCDCWCTCVTDEDAAVSRRVIGGWHISHLLASAYIALFEAQSPFTFTFVRKLATGRKCCIKVNINWLCV